MTARKIFSIVTMVLIVFLIVNMFIPMMSVNGNDLNLWDFYEVYYEGGETTCRVVFIVGSVLSLLACVLQLCGAIKDYKGAYLFNGYCFYFYITLLFHFIEWEVLEYASVGFWLGLIVATLTVAMIYIGNLLNNEKKKKPSMEYNTKQNLNDPSVIGYNAKTGEPIYAKVKGYDPETGEPIYAKPKGFNPETGEPVYTKPKGYDPETGEPIYE